MRKDGSDGVVVSQPPLVEEAVARRVRRVLGSLEDMAVRALAMDGGTVFCIYFFVICIYVRITKHFAFIDKHIYKIIFRTRPVHLLL